MLSTMKPRRGGGEGRKNFTARVERKAADDKYSIKNLIFMPSRPNYIIPVDTEGHKVYFCIDCGDRFVCESSYNHHVNRRSLKITYNCRNCSKTMVYMNRCNLLSHIRSHVFKTATINLMDLKVEPLPVEDMLFGLFHLNEPLTMEQVIRNEEIRKRKDGSDKSIENDPRPTVTTSEVEVEITPEVEVVLTDDSEWYSKKKVQRSRGKRKIRCLECNTLIPFDETIGKTRAKHYTEPGLSVIECPICGFQLPNQCAMDAHIRIHKNLSLNCICPECGEYIHKKHNCVGFVKIRLVARAQCPVGSCEVIRLMNFRSHYLENHMKLVYKCGLCEMACLLEAVMHAHLVSKHPGSPSDGTDVSMYYQCALCPGRLVLKARLNSHIDSHKNMSKIVYPCRKCGLISNTISDLLVHNTYCMEDEHKKKSESRSSLKSYRSVKLFKTNNEEVTYKSDFSGFGGHPHKSSNKSLSDINMPSESVNCEDETSEEQENIDTEKNTIKCPICKVDIDTVWDKIKEHFSTYHKKHHCIDVNLQLGRCNENTMKQISTHKRKRETYCAERSKARRRQRNILAAKIETNEKKSEVVYDKYACQKCGDSSSTNTETFKHHILTHRDPSTAYQCMECGFCFVVKPSFSTHLFVAHGIKDADLYIKTNDCYNDEAFKETNTFIGFETEPLKENQCKICRDEFNNEDDLDKHFRVHGMAFLMTKKQNKS